MAAVTTALSVVAVTNRFIGCGGGGDNRFVPRWRPLLLSLYTRATLARDFAARAGAADAPAMSLLEQLEVVSRLLTPLQGKELEQAGDTQAVAFSATLAKVASGGGDDRWLSMWWR